MIRDEHSMCFLLHAPHSVYYSKDSVLKGRDVTLILHFDRAELLLFENLFSLIFFGTISSLKKGL